MGNGYASYPLWGEKSLTNDCTDEKDKFKASLVSLQMFTVVCYHAESGWTILHMGCLHNNDHYYVNIQEISFHHDCD